MTMRSAAGSRVLRAVDFDEWGAVLLSIFHLGQISPRCEGVIVTHFSNSHFSSEDSQGCRQRTQ